MDDAKTEDLLLWREINGRIPGVCCCENLKMFYSLFFFGIRLSKFETFHDWICSRFFFRSFIFTRFSIEIHRFIFLLINSFRPRERERERDMVKGETEQDLNVGEMSFQDLNHIGNEPRTRFRFTSICGVNAFCDHKPMDLDVYEAMAVSSFDDRYCRRKILIQFGIRFVTQKRTRSRSFEFSKAWKNDFDRKNHPCDSLNWNVIFHQFDNVWV